jgi:hypothetical protein
VTSTLSSLVQRDNAGIDELRARNALQSSGAGSRAACGCFWAAAIVRPRTAGRMLPWRSDRAGAGAPRDRCVANAVVRQFTAGATKAVAPLPRGRSPERGWITAFGE